MSISEAIILGVIQGFTEFLPVSSSGHLVLGQALLGVDDKGITFEVFVHFGTLMSVIIFYWREILGLIRAFLHGLTRTSQIRDFYRQDRNFRWVVFIIIGTVPAGVIGILFEDRIARSFNDARMVAVTLIITGVILLLTRYIRPSQKELSLKHAILVGCAQAIAILPGISRSGTTISAALYLGVSREEAVRFSFLLSIPVILGATLLKLSELMSNLPSAKELLNLGVGTGAAFISGLAAIKLLVMIAHGGKLDYFSWYCFTVGIVGLLYL